MPRKNDEKWMEQFEVYKRYVGENLRFPPVLTVYEGYKIGAWFRNQVVALRGGFLAENRKALMDGFQPGWEDPRGVRDESELKMCLASDWRSRVPEGCMPIDALFQDEARLGACLRLRIYDVETFFYIGNHLSVHIGSQKKALFTQENCKDAFWLLFPSLDAGHIRLFQALFGYDGADDFEKACRFFQQHISSFRENVETALGTLTGNEERVLRAVYGIDGRAPQNFNQIAVDMGLTHSRIHQIAVKGIQKLRRPSCVRKLLTDYDGNGWAREQLLPRSGALLCWRYDKNGNCTYHQRSNAYWGNGSDSFWEKKTYDQNNKMTLYENNCGGWEKAEYNSNGDLLALKKSDGFWEKNVYDANGNCVLSQRSDGWWEKREYDAENRLTLLTDSNGRVERYRDRPRYDSGVLEMSIDELDLSVRAWHCLAFSNIRTVGDLIGKTRDDLFKVRNMGKKSLDEIEEKLAARGLQLMAESGSFVFSSDFSKKDRAPLAAQIAELDLSVRTYNCLRRAGLRTIGDLTGKSREDLMRVRNIGRKCLEEIDEKLAMQGLKLAEPDAEPINEGGKDACVAVGILDDMIADAQGTRQAEINGRDAFLLGEPGER